MIRLGHIEYSNCLPVHAQLVDSAPPAGIEVVTAVPSTLNAALARGEIDVAPCSSIEYARHASEYRVLPDFVIGSDGPVRSILFETTRSPRSLDDADVAVPTASATSVVLLRILLERHWGVRPRLHWHDQTAGTDPIEAGAAGVLRIGDVALRRRAPAGRQVHDLGEVWTDWTGLPFAFAVWQVRNAVDATPELAALHGRLHASRRWFGEHVAELAARWAPRYALPADVLADYWQSLRYELDARMQRGLLRYYALAAELGEASRVAGIDWADVGTGGFDANDGPGGG